MIISNFHTHTYRCHHAKGTEREYIESAIKAGIKVLGFSDHSPYYFDTDYYSNFRMHYEDVEEYISTVRKLGEEYKNDIKIFVGFEAEYYPKLFDKFIESIKKYNIDYLLLGQHYTKNEYDGAGVVCLTNDNEKIFFDYVNQVIDGLKTGYFSYLAHPDVPNFSAREEVYVEGMSRICKLAKEMKIPLECNMWGKYTGRHYPSKRFFDIASKYNNDVIFGIDAHNVDVIDKCQEMTDDAFNEFFKNSNVNIVDKIKLLNGKIV